MEISELIFPVDTSPYGFSFDVWTQMWWKWLLSIPKNQNPSLDTSGINSDIKQVDSRVKFLCQTIEGVQSVPTRITTLKESQSILMPIINWISISPDDGSNDADLLKLAKKKMDVIKELKVSINGMIYIKNLKKLRIRSECFNINLPEENIVNMDYGVHRAASDGYWLFLKPRENDFNIKTHGSCSRGKTIIGVNYDIKILPTKLKNLELPI